MAARIGTEEKEYEIAIIADLDKKSKVQGEEKTWKSYLKYGKLIKNKDENFQVSFDQKEQVLTSHYSSRGRGMELSELCWFNGKLYSPGDKTGIIYDITDGKEPEATPWVTLHDGDGENDRGFKGEWMTVKDGVTYVGSHGSEWVSSTGEVKSRSRMWVKTITEDGSITNYDWRKNYEAIRAKLGIEFPGYVIHEAVVWSYIKQKWFFLPRKVSSDIFDDKLDERRCSNALVSASADFTELNVVYVGELDVTRGFSTLKFVPGTNDDVAIALKTTEMDDVVQTYVTVFEVETGAALLPDQLIDDDKFEGIAFMDSQK